MIHSSKQPVFISGPGRSGTTWLQKFLNESYHFEIKGQLPMELSYFSEFLDVLEKTSSFTKEYNENPNLGEADFTGYNIPQKNRLIVAEAFYQFLGYTDFTNAYHFGFKAIWSVTKPEEKEALNRLFPNAKYIICIREPYKTYKSIVNTFEPNMEFEWFMESWIKSLEFYEENDNAILFEIDKLANLTPVDRVTEMNKFLEFFNSELTPGQMIMLNQWKTVHKFIPDEQRTNEPNYSLTYTLEEQYKNYARKYGYL